MRAIARQCGYESGRDTDKMALCQLTALPAHFLQTPMIQECPLNVECNIESVHHLEDVDLWIGRILAMHVDEVWANGRGGVELEHYQPLFYAFGYACKRGDWVGPSGF